jgi:hypothetical protein
MERSISCDYSVRGRGVWTHVLTSARTLTVNLPEIIAHSSMDPESVAFLRQTLEDFLQ